MPPKKKSLKKLADGGTVANGDGSRPQRALADLQKITFGGVVSKNPKCAFLVQKAVMGLYRTACVKTPLMVMAMVLAVYVVARQCSTKSGIQEVSALVGGSMSLDMYYHILDTINPVTAMSMWMVVSALDLHPVYKDQGSDYFYSNGAEWWTTQVGCCRDRATARAIISTALFILAVRSETALTYFYGEYRPFTPIVR